MVVKNASAIIIPWTGADEINAQTISFIGFQSDGLQWIGDGYYHKHGTPNDTVTLDVLADGSWINVYMRVRGSALNIVPRNVISSAY